MMDNNQCNRNSYKLFRRKTELRTALGVSCDEVTVCKNKKFRLAWFGVSGAKKDRICVSYAVK